LVYEQIFTAGAAATAESLGINIPGAAAMTDVRRLSTRDSLNATILRTRAEQILVELGTDADSTKNECLAS
jgi:hypothetical protein